MDPKQVRGVDAAQADVRDFANEVVKRLDEIAVQPRRVSVA